MAERVRIHGSKSIEAVAAEQEVLDRQERLETGLRRLFVVAFVLLGIGWFLLRAGRVSSGAACVLAGLVGWGLSARLPWDLKGRLVSWASALAVGFLSTILFVHTRAPGFQWGADSAFYRAVLEGHVPSCLPSPLAYLVAQAFLPILRGVYPDLPLLTACCFGAAMALLTLVSMEEAHPSREGRGFALLGSITVAATLPIAIFATQGNGLVEALGVCLALLLGRVLASREKVGWTAFYLAGLMASVHPLWGLLGLLFLAGRLTDAFHRLPGGILAYLAGCLPYLWVWLRAGKTLGGWGGDHPLSTLVHGGKDLWLARAHDLPEASQWASILGFSLAALYLALFLIGWKTKGVSRYLLAFALAGSSAAWGASRVSVTPGTLATFLPVVAFFWWLSIHREAMTGKGYGSRVQRFLAWASVAVTLALGFLPSGQAARYHTSAPQRHAENLLAGVSGAGDKVLLLVEDPFEADALPLALSRGALSNDVVVVAAPLLAERWYLSELIQIHPEILLSSAQGQREAVFNDLVRRNLPYRTVEWSVSEMPPLPSLAPTFAGFKGVPRVLTHRLVGLGVTLVPDDPSFRYDVSELMEEASRKKGAASVQLGRYAAGLHSWAVAQSRAGRYPAALRGFERASSLDPTLEAPRAALERLYSEKSMAGAARLQFEQIAKDLPPRLQALERALGRSAPEGRETLLARKAKLTDDLVDALHHLGAIYERSGRLDDSRRVLEMVLHYNPSKAETQLALAKLFLKAGHKTPAQRALKAVLEADPQNKEAQAELWKLINKP